MRKALLAAGLIVIVGCSSTPETQTHKTETTKDARVKRSLSLDWKEMSRGGAAMRQASYIHVLGDSGFEKENAAQKERQAKEEKTALKVAEIIKKMNKVEKIEAITGKNYSLYELTRWERFCTSGAGMDERDWLFIEKQGGKKNVPSLIKECTPPTHSYKDYLKAWTNFCSGEKISTDSKTIIRQTSRPHTTANPCNALKKVS